MNSLSWLIYMADVLPGISGLMILLAICIGLLAIFGAVAAEKLAEEDREDNEDERRAKRQWWPRYYRFLKLSGFAIPLLFLASVLIPSKTTIYMIAASETGEMVVQSPEAKELLSDVHKLIKQKIKEELGD